MATTLDQIPSDVSGVRALIGARHEDYTGDLGSAWWTLVRAAHDGTGGFRASISAATANRSNYGEASYESSGRTARASYLVPYPRENDAAYARRIDASTYYNYTAPTIRAYAGILDRKPPKRASTSAAVNAWWADCDGTGTPVAKWIADGRHGAQLYGWRAALIDRPRGVYARGTVKTTGRWLEPEEAADWQRGTDGALDWVRLVSAFEDRNPATGALTKREVCTIWTREDWASVTIETRPDGTQTVTDRDGAPHPLGRVPVLVLRWQRPTLASSLYGLSQVDAVVAANLDLFNVASELREHIRSQVFGILCAQSNNPEYLRDAKLGTNNGLVVEENCAFPSFVAPPQSIAMTLEMRMAGIVAEIYRAAGLEQPKADQAGQASEQSGVARAYDFDVTARSLASFATSLAFFERECAATVDAWDGGSGAGTSVEYETSFAVDDARQELAEAFAVLDEKTLAEVPPAVRDRTRRQIAALVYPQPTPEESATIDAQCALRADYDAAKWVQENTVIGTPKATIRLDLVNSFTSPNMSINEVRSAAGLPSLPDPAADTVAAVEDARSKATAAAQAAELADLDAALAEQPPPPPGTTTVAMMPSASTTPVRE